MLRGHLFIIVISIGSRKKNKLFYVFISTVRTEGSVRV
jgi:hypothetical protein